MRFIPGLARDRVRLLQPTTTAGDLGGPVVTFADAGGRSARRLRFTPTEMERDDQRQGTAAVQLLLRLDTLTRLITTEWRLTYEGQQLQVDGVDAQAEHGTVLLIGTAVRA